MYETTLQSSNGKDMLHLVIWEPEKEVRAIIQISHGMTEYILRYHEFAEYLNRYGILAVGNDHIGHGTTAKKEDLGYFGSEMSKTVVEDLHKVTTFIKNKFGSDIPYFLFGHSMGSFMARRYLMTYGTELDGAILSGTGFQPAVVLAAGKLAASVIGCFRGERYRSEFLRKMAFGYYNKKIDHPESGNDWLTKDREIVRKYDQDQHCTFHFTVNGYQTLFDVLSFIQDKRNAAAIPDTLPILMVSGEQDPVGDYGRGVRKVYEQLKAAGIKDIKLVLYPEDRHELINETDRNVVYGNIRDWVLDHIMK